MAKLELVMPKMGESIMEATIIRWAKQPGDKIAADETVLEIATDKVDSEVPSPGEGVLTEVRYKEGDVVPVGEVIAVIDTAAQASAGADIAASAPTPAAAVATSTPPAQPVTVEAPDHGNGREAVIAASHSASVTSAILTAPQPGRFYSPLVLNIAREEGLGMDVLERIPGTGNEGRVTKKDILDYVAQVKAGAIAAPQAPVEAPVQSAPRFAEPPAPSTLGVQLPEMPQAQPKAEPTAASKPTTVGGGEVAGIKPKQFQINGAYDIVEMDRMRKMIAENMVYSKHVSPHVTSFVEADVTHIVQWRDKVKGQFEKKYGEKLTFTPIFIEAIARALRDFPMVNIAVDGDKILVRKDINVGMATALPTGNLIVPVIKRADQMNLMGLAKNVNDLSGRARAGKLSPDDLSDGTYTVSNVGTFGNVMGTPIILQPQCAILAVGAIRKKPAVMETPTGDVIAVRHLMMLSHSYDHRVIDGALGGSFVRRVADYLEQWDLNREV